MKPYKKPLSLVFAEKRAQLTQPPIAAMVSKVRKEYDHALQDQHNKQRSTK